MREARSLAQLAKGPQGEILQVGSYRTDLSQTISTTPVAFDVNTVIRLQAIGDCWIDHWAFNEVPAPTITISGVGNDLDGVYNYNSGTGEWAGGGSDGYIRYSGGVWLLINDLDGLLMENPAPKSANPPLTGWVDVGVAVSNTPTIVLTGTVAADGEGMLLIDGAEITMLVYANDTLSVAGGTLNATPVAK